MILKSSVGKFWSYSLIKLTNFKSRFWTCDTWDLKVPGESLGAVDNSTSGIFQFGQLTRELWPF